MAEMFCGEMLMECIANQGRAPLFSIADGGYNIMFKWRHANPPERGPVFVTPRHEAAGAHMADGYYRVAGAPATAVAGAGPGAANLISGVIVASGEDVPMLVITTSRRTDLIAPLRGAMQTFEQVRTFAPVCKMSIQLTCPERLPSAIETAYKTAMSGIPGPVHIDIPEDVMNSKFNAAGIEPSKKIDDSFFKMGADEGAIDEAARMLVNAKEAMIHCGATVVRSGAWAEVAELAEYLGITVTTSPGGRGAIPEDHPNSIVPTCGMARASLSQTDVVLAVGCKFGELDFYGKMPLWGLPGAQKLIQIHRVAERLGMNKPVDVPLVGHAPIVLRQLIEKVKSLTAKRDPHPKLKQYRDLQNMWEKELAQKHLKKDAPMNTGHVVTAVRDFFDRDAIMVMDGGNTSMWNSNFNRILAPRTLLWTGDFGHLGTGVPFAVGAQLAAPDKKVVLISGDGAFGFNAVEIETARRNNLPIIVVVAADNAWGMEKSAQQRCFGTTDYYVNVEHTPARYDKFAEAFSCFGAYVDKAEALPAALKAAVDSGLPAVIHAAVDPEANVYPPGGELWAGSKQAK